MNPISLLPTLITDNLSVAIVGICVIFFVALLISRMWSAPRHEEISICQSWDASGKPRRNVQRVK